MRKTAPPGEFLTNVARGGVATQAPLTKELKTLTEKTAKLFYADFAGVDIMYDKKKTIPTFWKSTAVPNLRDLKSRLELMSPMQLLIILPKRLKSEEAPHFNSFPA